MNRIIEKTVGQMPSAKRTATSARPTQLTARWQNGLEAGGIVQRKLRLGFVNALEPQPAN